MTMITATSEREALRFYEQSRGNGSYHELALRIAAAAWHKSYPDASEAEAASVVRSAVRAATVAKPSR